MTPLHARLEAHYDATDVRARLPSDPVAFPRRYDNHMDQEVAAILASGLSFGRVASFRPVLEALFAAADGRGGPHAWVRNFTPSRDAPRLASLYYRWVRGEDLVTWVCTLQRAYREVETLEAWFPDVGSESDLRHSLSVLVGRLRSCAVEASHDRGVRASDFGHLSRGLRYFLPDPRSGSACKRWCMALRWLVRPATEGIDLGLWRTVAPRHLVIPVDTHVLRISRFLGLTERRDGSWLTARSITDSLSVFDPEDPTRYDFALAHLGISGGCRGDRHPVVCPSCPLDQVCTATGATR